MGARRPSWCKCKRNRLCSRHAQQSADIERAFKLAENPPEPMERQEVKPPEPPSFPKPGDDVGYLYGKGRYQPGREPRSVRVV